MSALSVNSFEISQHHDGFAVSITRNDFIQVAVQQPASTGIAVGDQFAQLLVPEDPAFTRHQPGVRELPGGQAPYKTDAMPVAKLQRLVDRGIEYLPFEGSS